MLEIVITPKILWAAKIGGPKQAFSA